MTAPTVSVVVPAYRNGTTLAETIDSILSQEGVNFELVIADHASDDDTLAVAERYAHDPRVRVLTTPAGGGAVRNWQRVTDAASGEFLKLVCGDDVLRPGVLARQATLLRSTGAAVTACRRDIIGADGRVLMRAWGLRGLGRRMPGERAVRTAVRAGSNVFGEPASVMMRRDALVSAGGWFAEFPYLIDQATYSRVLIGREFVPDEQVGATFRMTHGQWSVALVASQAQQARAFHRWLLETHPGVVSPADVGLGNARAWIMARLRRASYRVLSRRMR